MKLGSQRAIPKIGPARRRPMVAAPPLMNATPEPAAPQRSRGGSRLQPGLLFVIGLAGCVLLDRALYPWMLDFGLRTERALGEYYDLFRRLGEYATWGVIAALLWFADRADRGHEPQPRRALKLILACAAAGLTTAVLKPLIRRGRPRDHGGEFWFGFDEASSSGFGMPSGDVALAAAGLYVLYRLLPGAWPIWVFLGLGCALCRLLTGAHFLSDVFVGAALGCVCAWLVMQRAQSLPAPRAPSPVAVAAWVLLLFGAIWCASAATAWTPGRAVDVPGVYIDMRREQARSTFWFRPDGSYAQALLTTGEASTLEAIEGRWRLEHGELQLDDTPATPFEVSGRLIRWGPPAEAFVLERKGR